jgi:hypothetical protein
MRLQIAAWLIALTSSVASSVLAQQGLQEVPEAAPPPPETIKDGQVIRDGGDAEQPEDQELQPDVTIVQRKDATIEEYRLNGRLYMIKVVPFVGKPYYLIDNNGDGVLESRLGDIRKDPVVPKWVILSW